MGSLNNNAFTAGYRIQNASITDGRWREIFNGDATAYGGGGLANDGAIESADGSFTAALPANSVVVFLRQ
jgi:1,4-alpha-glucan branching enzyme